VGYLYIVIQVNAPIWHIWNTLDESNKEVGECFHQGQDFHLNVNGIDLLKVPRPQWSREFNDVGHYDVFGRFLGENLSTSGYVVLLLGV